MRDHNKATVLRFIKAMSRGDATAADACLAPASVPVTADFRKFTATTEREAIIGTIGSIRSLLPTGMRAKILAVISDKDRVAVEFEGDAETNVGRPFYNQYCMTFTLRNGRIVGSHEYFSTIVPKSKSGVSPDETEAEVQWPPAATTK